jgi:hypothetical protein
MNTKMPDSPHPPILNNLITVFFQLRSSISGGFKRMHIAALKSITFSGSSSWFERLLLGTILQSLRVWVWNYHRHSDRNFKMIHYFNPSLLNIGNIFEAWTPHLLVYTKIP